MGRPPTLVFNALRLPLRFVLRLLSWPARRALLHRVIGVDRRIAVSAAIAIVLALAAGSYAYFTNTGSVSGTPVSAGSLNPPTNAAVPASSTASVSVSWTASSTAGGAVAPQGYYVTRTNVSTEVTANACGTTAPPEPELVTGTSCTDTSVPEGNYTYKVTAVYNSWSATSASSGEVSVGPATKLVFTTQPPASANVVAGASTTFKVSVEEAGGTVVTSDNSTAVNLGFAAGGNPGSSTLACTNTGGTGPVMVVAGVATFTCSLNKTGTNYQLSATDSTGGAAPHPYPAAASNLFNIVPGAAFQLVFTSTVSGNQTVSSSASVGPFAIQVQDSFGNPVTNAGAAVTLSLSTTSGGTSGHTPFFTTTSGGESASTVTIANGASSTESFYYSDTKAGSPTIEVGTTTINSHELSAVTTSGFTMVAGTVSSLSLAATSPVAAGATDNLTVTALDAYGNTATSYTGSHSLTFGGPEAIGSHEPTVTNEAGTAKKLGEATAINFTAGVSSVVETSKNGQMILYKAQTKNLTVTDGTHTNGAGLSITVEAAGVSSLSLAATSPVAAGATDNLTVTALDAYGNTATSYTGSHSLTFGGPEAIGSHEPTVTNEAGTAKKLGEATAINFTAGVSSVVETSKNGQMILYKAQTKNLTVTDGTHTNGAGLSITVEAAGVSSLSLAATSPVAAGATDNLTVTALDAYGNTATSYTGSHSLTFGGPEAIGSHEPTVTNEAGTAKKLGEATAINFTAGVSSVVETSKNGQMILYKAQTKNLTVTDGTHTNGAGLSITVEAAGVSSLSLAATSPVAAGATDNLTVTALDAYGNTATSYTGSHSLTFGGPEAIGSHEPTVTNEAGTAKKLGEATAINFTAGVSSVVETSKNGQMILYKAQTKNLTVTDGTHTNGAGLSITVEAAGVSSLSLAATSPVAAGATDNLTVTALDAYGNTATSYTGSHSLTFGGPEAIGSHEPTVTNEAGTAKKLGEATAINFTAGVSSVVETSKNGQMILYKAEAPATITVTEGSHTGSKAVTVEAGTPAKVAITPNPGATTPSTTTHLALTFQLQDSFGNNATAGTGGVELALSTTGAGKFATTTGVIGSTTLSFTIASGSSSATEYFGDDTSQTTEVKAAHSSTTWGTDSIIVAAAPVVYYATAGTLLQGASAHTITITGANFSSGASLSVSITGTTGITTSSPEVISSTTMTVKVTVPAGQTIGDTYGISVTDGSGVTGQCGDCFAVNSSASTPSVVLTFPVNGETYAVGNSGGSSWNKKDHCTVGTGEPICGTASDTGATISAVAVSIIQESSDGCWSTGSTYTSLCDNFVPVSTGTATWGLNFSKSDLPVGNYVAIARMVDSDGNTAYAIATFTAE